MAKRRNGAALLDDVLTRRNVDVDWLKQVLRERVQEDIHLEYKRGEWLMDEGGFKLRKWVSGFANADGGVLIVGASNGEGKDDKHPPWSIDNAVAPNKQPLATWAAQTLTAVAPHLRTAPHIDVIDCGEAQVLVIACQRADALVPIVSGGELQYFLRVGDGVAKVPPYLHADLVLGRRSTPKLDIQMVEVQIQGKPTPTKRQDCHEMVARVELTFEVQNNSIIWADGIYAGILVPSAGGYFRPAVHELVQSVRHDYEIPEEGIQHAHVILDENGEALRPLIKTFATATTHIFWGEDRVAHTAMYIGARNAPPRFFSARIRMEKCSQNGRARPGEPSPWVGMKRTMDDFH